jgi:regulator of chromosome condensation
MYSANSQQANDGILGFSTNDAIEGDKTKNPEKKQQRKPVLVPILKKIVSLAAGSDHILALDDKGKVFAWGTGEQSQLGRRIMQRTRYQALTPSRVALPKIKQIACGAYHSFAIDESGSVHAWGSNNFGQTGLTDGIGEGDATVLQPGIVEGLQPYKIRHIQGGLHHSVACTEDGQLLVWGRCDDGQAGIKLDTLPRDKLIYDERDRPRILKLATIPDLHAVSVAAGIDNCFAITEDGKAFSWGFSANYRTCQGTEETVKEATMVGKGGVKLSYAGCGGQFSVLAGPVKSE